MLLLLLTLKPSLWNKGTQSHHARCHHGFYSNCSFYRVGLLFICLTGFKSTAFLLDWLPTPARGSVYPTVLSLLSRRRDCLAFQGYLYERESVEFELHTPIPLCTLAALLSASIICYAKLRIYFQR